MCRILINANVRVYQKVHIRQDLVKTYLSGQGHYGGFDKEAAAAPGTAPLPDAPAGTPPGPSPNGIYKVIRVDQDGSVQEQEWYTTLTCAAMGKETQTPPRPPGRLRR